MNKDIRTGEAGKELVKKFLDYANYTDESYALLEYVYQNIEQDEKQNIPKADGITLGDKLKQDIWVKNSKGENIIKPKGTNTAYACAIEARFMQNKIVGKEGNWCISFADFCLTSKDKTIANDITNVKPTDKLSDRTINFVNRFKLLKHCPNTSNGFSATLFEDKESKEF